MAYTVVQEHQYEVIIVPALLVGGFLILLAIILWLFIRGQRSQRQHPGTRGKTQTMELGIGSGKIDFKKVIGQGFHRSKPQQDVMNYKPKPLTYCIPRGFSL